MTLLSWFDPLESATSLDAIATLWPALLERHHLASGQQDGRYQDAVMSFLGRSSLPAHLRLGAVLAFVCAEDIDLRLALGCIGDEAADFATEWPASVGSSAAMVMPCLMVASSDQWLSAFVNGRLLGLRDTMGHDGTRLDDWTQVFWNKFLEMSSRWADLSGVKLALGHGAEPSYDNFAAIKAAAKGTHGNFRSAYYTEGRTHADYFRVFDDLAMGTDQIAGIHGVALRAAAAADNDEMLAYLASQGADIHGDSEAALVAASSCFAITAVEWLLERGADVHAANEAALIAAVAAFDTSTVEVLLDAGADVHVDGELPLRTAFTSNPYHLYSCESDLTGPRSEMISLLTSRGADVRHASVAQLVAKA